VRQTRFLRAAEAEADEAVAYFDEQRPGLGDRFEQELTDALEVLKQFPRSGKPLTTLVRKLRLRTFRYNLVYVANDNEVVIVAVAHHRRHPDYWQSRLFPIH
jgi:plasmid stabilization system protein ParE